MHKQDLCYTFFCPLSLLRFVLKYVVTVAGYGGSSAGTVSTGSDPEVHWHHFPRTFDRGTIAHSTPWTRHVCKTIGDANPGIYVSAIYGSKTYQYPRKLSSELWIMVSYRLSFAVLVIITGWLRYVTRRRIFLFVFHLSCCTWLAYMFFTSLEHLSSCSFHVLPASKEVRRLE